MAVKGVGRRVEVSDEDRRELERIVRASSSEVRMVERARIVLAAGEGLSDSADRCSGGVLGADGEEVASALCASWDRGVAGRAAVGAAVDARSADEGAVDREGVHASG